MSGEGSVESNQTFQDVVVPSPPRGASAMTHPAGSASVPVPPAEAATYDLDYMFDNPINAVENFPDLMDMCLRANNPHAHFLKGMHEYFGLKNIDVGLEHIKRSADTNYDNATYLYGLLMISTGKIAAGKRYMSALGYKTSMTRADQCWEKLKQSLQIFDIAFEDCYMSNMMRLKPARRCHVNSFTRRCKRCYLYKQVMKFIDYI